jgi:hypothetical protein
MYIYIRLIHKKNKDGASKVKVSQIYHHKVKKHSIKYRSYKQYNRK